MAFAASWKPTRTMVTFGLISAGASASIFTHSAAVSFNLATASSLDAAITAWESVICRQNARLGPPRPAPP